MRLFYFIFSAVFFLSCSKEIPNAVPNNSITIVRDEYGVPHIIAKTNNEVAYGLGWVECEDDFVTMQELLAACKGRLGEIKGKDGLVADFGIKFMGIEAVAYERYEESISDSYKEYLENFVKSINTYAQLNPEKVILKDLFPIQPQDIITGYLLGNLEISGAGKDLQAILEGELDVSQFHKEEKGSNAIAISNKKTKNGETFLAINSHQPLEGWYSWYEAHLMSEEGLNILGGTFAGGTCIFHGVNENLGWAHTVNHGDFSDIFSLTINPKNENQYKFDGKWLELEEKQYWAWMKLIGPIKIPIRKTIYESVYGPSFKTDQGVFAWRFVVAQNIKMSEQWFEMNLASNFEEFQNALRMRGIPSTNIVYADKNHNIYYISNGRLPKRDKNYDWKGVIKGDTSATLWGESLIDFDSLPQVINPECGWVFNTNNTPFSASCSANNFKQTALNQTMSFQPKNFENNRSIRFLELINQYDSVSYSDFKKIKYDVQYPSKMMNPNALNLEALFSISKDKHPKLAPAIDLLKNWNRNNSIENTTAALFHLTWKYMVEKMKKEKRYRKEII